MRSEDLKDLSSDSNVLPVPKLLFRRHLSASDVQYFVSVAGRQRSALAQACPKRGFGTPALALDGVAMHE